jgi:hypothetical protein
MREKISLRTVVDARRGQATSGGVRVVRRNEELGPATK